jgi:hypothetical protein
MIFPETSAGTLPGVLTWPIRAARSTVGLSGILPETEGAGDD